MWVLTGGCGRRLPSLDARRRMGGPPPGTRTEGAPATEGCCSGVCAAEVCGVWSAYSWRGGCAASVRGEIKDRCGIFPFFSSFFFFFFWPLDSRAGGFGLSFCAISSAWREICARFFLL